MLAYLPMWFDFATTEAIGQCSDDNGAQVKLTSSSSLQKRPLVQAFAKGKAAAQATVADNAEADVTASQRRDDQ